MRLETGRSAGKPEGLEWESAWQWQARLFCHSEEHRDEESQAMREYYVYILTNETRSLPIESESPVWVDLSAEWLETLDSSRSLP